MKHKLLSISLLCLALAGGSVHASTLYWSGSGTTLGGAGTWNTTAAHWGTDTGGPFSAIWVNANSDSANLYSNVNGGNITLGSAITMKGTFTFDQTVPTAAGYTVSGAWIMTFNAGSAIYCSNVSGSGLTVGSFNAPYAGTITKSGAAAITFSNGNGSVTKFIFTGGTISFAAPNRFGASTSGATPADFLTFSGGQLSVNTTTAWTMGRAITVNSGGGTITSITGSSSVTVTQDQPITWNSGKLTISVVPFVLSSTASSGTGSLVLNNNLTTTCTAAGVIPSGIVLTMNTSTSTLKLSNFSQTVSTLSGSGPINLGSGTLTLSNGRNTYSGVISGTGGLVQNSSSFETLSGANTYTGPTTINSGALVFSGASTCTGATTVNSGGTLRIATSGTAFPNSPIFLAGGGTLDVNNLTVTIAGLSGSGNVSNNIGQALNVNGNLTTAGTTSGTGFQVYSCYYGALTNGSLIKDGTHAMALRGSNTFDGTFSFGGSGAAGTLSVGAAPNRLPPTTGLSVPAGALFQLDANNQTVSTLSGNGGINLGGGILTDNEGVGNTFYGIIQDSELPGSSTALGHGLRGYYYDNIDMTNLKAVRDDATVNFTDLTSASQLPDAIYSGPSGTNTVSIRWLGQILSTAAGTYNFTTTCDDGRRLWVNGQLVVDDWLSGSVTKSGTIDLAANTKYDIVLEFFNGSGASSARLLWMPPGDTTTNVIPTDYLFLPGPGTLVKDGAGTALTLTSANTYSGDTFVAAGTLVAQADGALGNGNVTVSNANLILQYGGTNGYMSPSANLSLIGNAVSPMVTLNFAGAEDIRGLSIDGVSQPAGTYGSTSSTATYQDNTHFDVNYSGMLNVVGAPSTTVLMSSGSPSAVYGSPLTLTATVTPAGVTGAVTFYDGANWLGLAALNGSGVATLAVANLQVTASPHALTAVYNGDAAHAPSTSGTVSQITTVATLTPNIVVSNKVYDGTTTAAVSSATTFGGIYSGDTNYVHIAGTAVANFVDKIVGTGKTVNITGLSIVGSLASNYVMLATSASVTADITAKALTVTGLLGVNRPYDGSTAATFTGAGSLSGVISPDVVTLGGTPVASFATKTVGTGKTVTINGYTLGGADGGNYSVTPPTVTANITAVTLSVVGLTANSRIYDGTTTNITLTGTAVLSAGVVSPDDVTLGGTPSVPSFATKTVGTAKPVTVTGYTITGADIGNYTLSQPSLSADITINNTTCALLSSANPSTYASSVTFTATVSGNTPAFDSPTGNVLFSTGGVFVATVPVTATTPGSAAAAYSTAGFPVGTTTVRAQYVTDNNFGGSLMDLAQIVQSASSASPVIISNILGTTLTYGGGGGAKFILLQSAAANAPMSTWTYPGLTNTGTPGTFTIPAVGTGASLYYRIKSE